VVREAITEFLDFVGARAAGPYREFALRLQAAMEAIGERTLIDLCSGAGGPVARIVEILRGRGCPARAWLTDRFPAVARFEALRAASGGALDFIREPIDATAVPARLRGFRLISNGFHHFRPETARRILADAVRERQGIAVLELAERRLVSVLLTVAFPLVVLLVTPWIRPFRVSRLALTYLLPLVPLAVLWDGVVSCLRAYSPAELRELVAALRADEYAWEIGLLPFGRTPARLTYLVGRPRRGAALDRCPPGVSLT
jgi:hypothetical protein